MMRNRRAFLTRIVAAAAPAIARSGFVATQTTELRNEVLLGVSPDGRSFCTTEHKINSYRQKGRGWTRIDNNGPDDKLQFRDMSAPRRVSYTISAGGLGHEISYFGDSQTALLSEHDAGGDHAFIINFTERTRRQWGVNAPGSRNYYQAGPTGEVLIKVWQEDQPREDPRLLRVIAPDTRVTAESPFVPPHFPSIGPPYAPEKFSPDRSTFAYAIGAYGYVVRRTTDLTVLYSEHSKRSSEKLVVRRFAFTPNGKDFGGCIERACS